MCILQKMIKILREESGVFLYYFRKKPNIK